MFWLLKLSLVGMNYDTPQGNSANLASNSNTIEIVLFKLIGCSNFNSPTINRKRLSSYFLISASGSANLLDGIGLKPEFIKLPSTLIFSGSIVTFLIKLAPFSSTNLRYNPGNFGLKSEQSIPPISLFEQLEIKIRISKRVNIFFMTPFFIKTLQHLLLQMHNNEFV